MLAEASQPRPAGLIKPTLDSREIPYAGRVGEIVGQRPNLRQKRDEMRVPILQRDSPPRSTADDSPLSAGANSIKRAMKGPRSLYVAILD